MACSDAMRGFSSTLTLTILSLPPRSLGDLLQRRRHRATRPAPRRPEVDQHRDRRILDHGAPGRVGADHRRAREDLVLALAARRVVVAPRVGEAIDGAAVGARRLHLVVVRPACFRRCHLAAKRKSSRRVRKMRLPRLVTASVHWNHAVPWRYKAADRLFRACCGGGSGKLQPLPGRALRSVHVVLLGRSVLPQLRRRRASQVDRAHRRRCHRRDGADGGPDRRHAVGDSVVGARARGDRGGGAAGAPRRELPSVRSMAGRSATRSRARPPAQRAARRRRCRDATAATTSSAIASRRSPTRPSATSSPPSPPRRASPMPPMRSRRLGCAPRSSCACSNLWSDSLPRAASRRRCCGPRPLPRSSVGYHQVASLVPRRGRAPRDATARSESRTVELNQRARFSNTSCSRIDADVA